MQRYVANPKVIHAIQWNGVNIDQVEKWIEDLKISEYAARVVKAAEDNNLCLTTPLIDGELEVGDWLICNDQGAVFMASNEAFLASYSLFDETLDPDGGSHENPLS